MKIYLWSFYRTEKKDKEGKPVLDDDGNPEVEEFQPGEIIYIKDKAVAERILDGQGGYECDKDGNPVKKPEEAAA